jgi:hypothetical protein
MLVRGDNHGVDLGAREELAVIRGDEISAAFLANDLAALRIDFRDADPVDGRMASGQFTADEADAAGTDDRKTDALCLFPGHSGYPYRAAAATARDSGNGSDTGSLRSADRSAAM